MKRNKLVFFCFIRLAFFAIALLCLLPSCKKEPHEKTQVPAEITADTSDGPIHVKMTVKPGAVDLTRNTLVYLDIKSPDGINILEPRLDDRFQGFSLEDTLRSPRQKEKDGIRMRIAARLIPSATTEYRIAPIVIEYIDSRDGLEVQRWFITKPLVLNSLHNTKTGEFRDLVKKVWIPPTPREIIFYILLAVALLALLYLLWKTTKKIRRKIQLMMMSPRERALAELSDLLAEALPHKGMVKEFYLRLTMIVRRFIERAFSVRAPEQTTEEFLHAAETNPNFTQDSIEQLKLFLEAADLVKFAAHKPNADSIGKASKTAEDYIKNAVIIENKEGQT